MTTKLTAAQVRVLEVLSERPGLTHAELCAALGITFAQGLGVLARLRERGLVDAIPRVTVYELSRCGALAHAVTTRPLPLVTDPAARPLPAQQHSAPSIEAATGTAATRRRDDHRRIVAELERLGWATDRALQDALNLPGSTERPRRIELVRAGVVVADGLRTQRNGRNATAWRLADGLTLEEYDRRLAIVRTARKATGTP